MSNRVVVFLRIAAFLAAVCVSFGQVASRISGTVHDSSGALMSGVKVVVTDVDRGRAKNTVTNDAGRYAFPNLGVEKYVLSAEMSGFKRPSTAPITIDVN